MAGIEKRSAAWLSADVVADACGTEADSVRALVRGAGSLRAGGGACAAIAGSRAVEAAMLGDCVCVPRMVFVHW